VIDLYFATLLYHYHTYTFSFRNGQCAMP